MNAGTMAPRLKQAEGNFVIGDRFWDRKAAIDFLTKHIDGGAHILLHAQRRMGKTSFIHELARRLKDRYTCLFVDLQKAASAPEAIIEISLAIHPHGTLWGSCIEVFGNLLARVTEAAGSVEWPNLGVRFRVGLTAGAWAEKGDRLFDVLAASEKPVLLLCDEVPVMVNRMLKGDDFTITADRRKDADEFMSWLRMNSIKHQGRIQILISGSIGFESLLRQARLSATINNFTPFELQPWDEATALGCLKALANEYDVRFDDGAAEEMLRQLGFYIPHHVQMFFSRVYAQCKRRGQMEISAGEVKEIYMSEMLGARGRSDLTHYEERLRQILGPKVSSLALDMVTETAVTGRLDRVALAAFQKEYGADVPNINETQDEILRVLEHDGYLKPGPNGYVFVSKLLWDWWRRQHESFFTPVLKRERKRWLRGR